MKIAIICADFQKSNIKKLPWKYIHEIAKYLNKKHEIVVITDSDKQDIENLKLIFVQNLFNPFKGESEDLLNLIKEENPDKCIMLLGLTSFLRTNFKINKPVIGIFTSPIYSIRKLIKNIGIKNSLKYSDYTSIHFLNALIPDYMVKKWSEKFERIIFLSDYTQKKIIAKGLAEDKSFLIPLGLDKSFLEIPDIRKVENIKNKINRNNIPVIMYFTSPLILRGTDTLIKAFAILKKEIPTKLVFLSRMDHKELTKEVNTLKELAIKEGVLDSMKIISEYLSPEEIKEYLLIADVICLPFKIVISDVPVSLLEALALGRPVVSTNVACVPEILNERGILVEPNNPSDLADGIFRILNDAKLKKELIENGNKYIEKYPNWDFIGSEFTKIIE